MGKLKHIELEGHAYFLTTNAYGAQKILSDSKVADIVLSAIFFLQAKGYFRLYSFVIMPDHIHLIILPQGRHTISKIMHSLKSYTAKKINRLLGRSGKVWQDGFYERVIRNEADLTEKARYVEGNPVRKGLADEPQEYVYSSAHHRGRMDYF